MGRWRKDRTGGGNFADIVSKVSCMIYTRKIRHAKASFPDCVWEVTARGTYNTTKTDSVEYFIECTTLVCRV